MQNALDVPTKVLSNKAAKMKSVIFLTVSILNPHSMLKNILESSFGQKYLIFLLTVYIGFGLGHSAFAQDRGAAFFALNATQFPCDQALKVFKVPSKFTALAVLWSTFGNDHACLGRWTETMRRRDVPHILEIHLANETCRRAKNRKCSNREILPNLSVKQYNQLLEREDEIAVAALRDRVVEINAAVSPLRNPKLEIILSTGLEDNYTQRAYQTVLKVVRSNWPDKIVRNPVKRSSDSSVNDKLSENADYLELHGNTPVFQEREKCIVNLDGVDIVFPHRRSPISQRISWDETLRYMQSYQPRCRVTFLWSSPWQGLTSDKFPDPETRSFLVSDEDVEAIKAIP